MLKTINAGPYVWQATYSINRKTDPPAIRAAKREGRRDAQALIDFKYCYQKVELWTMCNLKPGDYHIALKFSNKHLPETAKQCRYRFAYFLKKIKQEFEARGVEFVGLWCLEKESSKNKRYHFHLICPRLGPKDWEIFKKCWKYGDVEFKYLRNKGEKTFARIAHYLAKEYPEKVGQHAWSCTRNSKRPVTTSERVPDNYNIIIPFGAEIIRRKYNETPFGTYEAAVYRVSDKPTDKLS